MTHLYYNKINNIIKKNKLHRFWSEIMECTDTERLTQLKKIYEQINNQRDQNEINEDKKNAHFEILKNSQYQKKWYLLNVTQKLNRFEDYISRNKITDVAYIDKMKTYINDNTIKQSDITYSTEIGQIQTFIPSLLLNDNKKELNEPCIIEQINENNILTEKKERKQRKTRSPTKKTSLTDKKEKKQRKKAIDKNE